MATKLAKTELLKKLKRREILDYEFSNLKFEKIILLPVQKHLYL